MYNNSSEFWKSFSVRNVSWKTFEDKSKSLSQANILWKIDPKASETFDLSPARKNPTEGNLSMVTSREVLVTRNDKASIAIYKLGVLEYATPLTFQNKAMNRAVPIFVFSNRSDLRKSVNTTWLISPPSIFHPVRHPWSFVQRSWSVISLGTVDRNSARDGESIKGLYMVGTLTSPRSRSLEPRPRPDLRLKLRMCPHRINYIPLSAAATIIGFH